MNKRRAKKEACRIVASLIDSYLDVGQPFNDCEGNVKGWTVEDGSVLAEAFDMLRLEMERRGDDRT